VEQEGEVAVPATVFSQLIANLGVSARGVALEVKNKALAVVTAQTKAAVKLAPPDDFPTLPRVGGRTISINPKVFTAGFKAVSYSASAGNLKPELGSVFLYTKENELVFAATDSFRLAEKRVLLKKNAEMSGILVPVRNLGEVCRILEDVNSEIAVSLEKTQISFAGEGFYVTSRIIDGSFPDYQQIIPKEQRTEAVALKEDVLQALRLATLFSDRFNQVHIKADPVGKYLEFSSRRDDAGENASHIAAALTGEAVESNFNHRYISDCMQAISSDSVIFRWNGEGKPLLVSGVGDKSFQYIVMPMNR
jgi:DNA polymerase-3 subunit beta